MHGCNITAWCTWTTRSSSSVFTTGAFCRGHSLSGLSRKSGAANQRLFGRQSGPFPHFVASSATLILVDIQRHSSGCVSSRISPMRTATYCRYLRASELIQESTFVESLQRNLRLGAIVWYSVEAATVKIVKCCRFYRIPNDHLWSPWIRTARMTTYRCTSQPPPHTYDGTNDDTDRKLPFSSRRSGFCTFRKCAEISLSWASWIRTLHLRNLLIRFSNTLSMSWDF